MLMMMTMIIRVNGVRLVSNDEDNDDEDDDDNFDNDDDVNDVLNDKTTL